VFFNKLLNLGALPIWLEYRAHFELGTTYYHLKDYEKAKHELEKAAEQADAGDFIRELDYVKQSDIWKWLEMTSRVLGLQAEQVVENAEHHGARANSQRQRKNRHKRKPKVVAHAADRVSEIA
jgi:tetratricopeptide (TPR) repeat protein